MRIFDSHFHMMDEQSAGNLRVLIVADDPLAHVGLSGLLRDWSDYTIVDAGPDERDLVDTLDRYQADVVLWDLGARADVSLTSDVQYVDPPLVVIDPDLAASVPVFREPTPQLEELTPRKEEVLQLLAEGLSNKFIADRLEISEHTVKFHVSSIFSKLGVHSRTEAVTRAARQGLLII